MKKKVLVLSSLILITSVSGIYAQKLIKEHLFAGVTYGSDKVNRIYIPPPDEFHKRKGTKAVATIDINYSGFTATAVNTVEYAASILETLLPDDVHIIINANWTNISTAGVLANSSTTGYAPGWGIDGLNPNAFYPVALAEKIYGQKLNDDIEGDIDLNINSSVSWYFGIDGNTPTLRYDLVTVVLHELIHGLGFFDSFFVEASTGSYGAASIPLIYDSFVENQAGTGLTDTMVFPNPSTALKTQLTTPGNIYFDGPVVKAFNSGSRALLYSPGTYDRGSSIAHLNEDTYKPEDPNTNALMTPFIARGEAIHNPGKLTRSILGDIGWINTRVVHSPPRDTEAHLSSVTIDALIKSDTSYNHNSVGLTWSFDNFRTSSSIVMASPGANDNYTAVIPVPGYGTRLEYFMSVQDQFLRTYLSPSDTSQANSVYIGLDTVKPVILHTPEDYYFSVVDSIKLMVQADDNIAMDTVYAEYRLNEGPVSILGFKNAGGSDYKAGFKASLLALSGDDSLQYRIIAIDSTISRNQRILPSAGFFSVKFEHINPVAESYSTDFSNSAADFLNNGFEIKVPAGFTGYGLHTKHPYESPEETGDSIGYTSILRTPVRFDGSGMLISFYEVVLVEPGEVGSLFGSPYFYDYVIVEGSRDFGENWFPLTDGYDSRYMPSWETAYNSSVQGVNSLYTGQQSMLVKHSIFPKVPSFISAGDTMLVRFRLFSDPYAHGWGWGIEDLHIGPLINSIPDVSLQVMRLYPNPGNGRFTLKLGEGSPLKPLRYDILNSAGSLLLSDRTDGSMIFPVDISAYPPGLYFIVLYDGSGIHTLKYNLIK